METESLNNKIKDHLTNGGSLTPITALTQFGCFRLSARIYDLRQRGLPIETNIREINGKKVAEYKLKSA